MSLETLIPFAPFLALLYVVYAFVQALRGKQQGAGAAILALLAALLPVAALILTANTTTHTSALSMFALNACIVFVASIIILLVERRNPARDSHHSYGMLGIGLSVILATALFVVPLLSTSTTTTTNAARTSAVEGSTIQNVRNTTSSAENATTETAGDAAAQTDSESEGAGATEFGELLAAEAGLTVEALTAEIEAGSTVAELVAANDGDLDSVTQAITRALDTWQTAGDMQAQMLSRLGTDTSAIAAQLVQGELPERLQQGVLLQLITGVTAARPAGQDGGFTPPEGGFTPPDGAAGGVPPNGDFVPPEGNAANDPAEQDVRTQTETAEPVENEQAITPVPSSTSAVIRPTLITFPTATATSAASEAEAESTAEALSAQNITCLITIDYNLNVRETPDIESAVLTSIPFGNSVSTDGRTEDGWYRVTYSAHVGWVSGDYVTPSAACEELSVLEGS